MWKVGYKESWVLKNWCFWTVVLDKTLERVHPKGNQSLVFTGRTDAEVETPVLWQLDAKNWLTGKTSDARKDWRQEEKGTTEDEMVGLHHWLNRQKFVQASEVCDGQERLAWCSSWGYTESDMTDWMNWTEDIKTYLLMQILYTLKHSSEATNL